MTTPTTVFPCVLVPVADSGTTVTLPCVLLPSGGSGVNRERAAVWERYEAQSADKNAVEWRMGAPL